MKKSFNLKRVLLGAVAVVASGAAAASGGPDLSEATGAFTAVSAGLDTVGPLMLGAAAAGIVYKWVVAFLI
jgi:hypothetical protein